MTISLRIKNLAVKALRMRIILRKIRSLWKKVADKALGMRIILRKIRSLWKKVADKALGMRIRRLRLITGPCG